MSLFAKNECVGRVGSQVVFFQILHGFRDSLPLDPLQPAQSKQGFAFSASPSKRYSFCINFVRFFEIFGRVSSPFRGLDSRCFLNWMFIDFGSL